MINEKLIPEGAIFFATQAMICTGAIDADRVPSLSISLYLTIITRRNVGLGDTPPQRELGDKIIQ